MGWELKNETNMCMYYTPDVINRMVRVRLTLLKTFRVSTTISDPEIVYWSIIQPNDRSDPP